MKYVTPSHIVYLKNSLLKFIRTIPNSAFSVFDIYEIKTFARLHVGLNHLREHKLRHNF